MKTAEERIVQRREKGRKSIVKFGRAWREA
jgi:hypothetical protein